MICNPFLWQNFIMKEIFISNINALRKENKLTQPQLAKETGLSKSAISSWESGERIPSAIAIIKLSQYFEVTSDYLLKISNDNKCIYYSDKSEIDMSIFRERLLKLRKNMNLTIYDLENILKLSKSALHTWEKGISIPNAQAVIKLADYFNVTTDYLLGLSD